MADLSKSIYRVSNKKFREIAEGNHIWLNAFNCIQPTDEFLRDLGKAVLAKLEDSEWRDGMGISKYAVFTINKS